MALRRDPAIAGRWLSCSPAKAGTPSALARRLRAWSFDKLRTDLSYVEGRSGRRRSPESRAPEPPDPPPPPPPPPP